MFVGCCCDLTHQVLDQFLSVLQDVQVGFLVRLKLWCLWFFEREVRCCSLGYVESGGRCHLVRPLVRMNLVSLSLPTSGRPPFVGRTLSSSFSSALESRNKVKSFVLVWIPFELGQPGIFVSVFVDSLGWLLQGVFVVFPWIPTSFSLWDFQPSLADSRFSPNDSHEVLVGSMNFPSDVQVSVVVPVVHPSGCLSVWVEYQRGSPTLCWTMMHSTLWVSAWQGLDAGRLLGPALDSVY